MRQQGQLFDFGGLRESLCIEFVRKQKKGK